METTISEVQKAINDALDSLQMQNRHIQNNGSRNIGTQIRNGDQNEPIMRRTASISNPGVELQQGEDCNVSISEIDYLERIIEDNNLLPVHFLEEGAVSQKAVARVSIPGVGYGTGFLVSNSLFITNNHVIGSVAQARKAKIEFNYQQDRDGNNQYVDTFSTNPDSVFYTNQALDFTLVRLKKKSSLNFIPRNNLLNPRVSELEANLDLVQPNFDFGNWIRRFFYHAGSKWGWLSLINSTYSVDQHVNVIQHPRARRKEVSLQDNNIRNIYTNHIRYTTDTEPGSSGSPVFNNAWDLIALHHAAGEKVNGLWVSNQGVRIDKIIANIRSNYSGSQSGQSILQELGI